MNQHYLDKRHDEWKTGNWGQDQFKKGFHSDEDEEDEEEVDYEWDDEIEENFETLENEREK